MSHHKPDVVMKETTKNVPKLVEVNDGIKSMSILATDAVCQYVDISLILYSGIYLQFVNLNATGSATMIGGVRIQLKDITKVPKYLSTNKSTILQWGASYLVQHLLDTQCPAAANEVITYEDFSISFSVATLSDEGRRLNPMGRNEGPVHFCVHPGLLQPAVLGRFTNGSIDEAHAINLYVHLLEAPKRGTSIMKKLKAEERAKQEAALQPKKPKYIRETYASRRPAPPPGAVEDEYPVLPQGEAPIQWPPSASSRLPQLPPY
jgi:hypothetical protein